MDPALYLRNNRYPLYLKQFNYPFGYPIVKNVTKVGVSVNLYLPKFYNKKFKLKFNEQLTLHFA